jgi:hypothetical protein
MKNSFIIKNNIILKSTCIFLLFLAVMNHSQAQIPHHYNYNNGGESNSFPFNMNGGKKVNWLFQAGELNQPVGITPDHIITDVYFWISTTGSRTYTDLLILMAQDTISSLTLGEFYSGLMDTVFYRASVTLSGISLNWMQIKLDNPYPYDPSKSLILSVGQCGSTGSGLSVFQTGLSVDYRRVWSVGGCPFTPYSSHGLSIVNFGVDIAPDIAITDVDSVDVSCYGLNNGSITVTASGGSGSLQYSADSGATWQTSNVFPGLNHGMYNIIVKDSIGYQRPYASNPMVINEPPVAAYFITDTCCNSYMLNDSVYTATGTYIQHLLSRTGCDSTITLILTVNPVYAFSENYSICNGDTNNWQGTDYTTAGTYTAGYTSINGCDSIYTLNLTVNPVYSFREDHSICDGETYNWQGTDYTTAGTYTADYTSINGCDSIYTLNLTFNTVDVSVTINNAEITANASGATYQWFDCNNAFASVQGAILQSYTATESGNYAVLVTQGSCSDTSDCVQITNVGIASFSMEGIAIYPNPVSNELIIEIKENKEQTDFEILNSTGQVVYSGNIIQKTAVNTSKFSSGVYLIKIKNGTSFEFSKIIKD